MPTPVMLKYGIYRSFETLTTNPVNWRQNLGLYGNDQSSAFWMIFSIAISSNLRISYAALPEQTYIIPLIEFTLKSFAVFRRNGESQ